jgi:phosphohistidine phosphatase SixA
VLLIRHARAGERVGWEGDDWLRPLDDRGRRQADRLVELLGDFAINRILSSPYDRCVQTVEPLARQRGLAVELREELSEELQAREGVALVNSLLATDAAVCCHGGLSDTVAGEPQKKSEVLVLGADAAVKARLRP